MCGAGLAFDPADNMAGVLGTRACCGGCITCLLGLAAYCSIPWRFIPKILKKYKNSNTLLEIQT